jgi:NAD-dependent dihydropyrimidine dehydrogenase PreA subunit
MEMKAINTLQYDQEKCSGCGMCSIVCPHRVFSQQGRKATLEKPDACMECGACERNCPAKAIRVDSGVGCAAAMIRAALTGKKEATCGSDDDESSCCD